MRRAGLPVTLGEGEAVASGTISFPLKRGSALFMTKLTMHASFSNTSDHIRWSFDLRYNPIGQATGREAFMPHVITDRVAEPKHVVIVGAGPAGLEAARVAAARGHRVTVL